MRTVERIQFTGPSVASVQEVLSRADCGPDVATYEDIPVLKQVFARVTLEETDARLPRLKALLAPDGSNWDVWHEDQFTKEELESAPLLLIEPNRTCEIDGGEKWGTTFDLSGACPVCATGGRQTSALFVDGEDVPKLEGHLVAETYRGHILLHEILVGALEDAAVSGLSLLGVYAQMPDGRQVRLRWKQLLPENVLPRMSRSTVGFAHEPWSEKIVPCAVCGRDGFLLTREAPTRPVYCTSALRGVLDINCTWENRGHAILRPSLRESVLSHPWIIVTPKVYRILRDAGVTEVDFHPIRVEDG